MKYAHLSLSAQDIRRHEMFSQVCILHFTAATNHNWHLGFQNLQQSGGFGNNSRFRLLRAIRPTAVHLPHLQVVMQGSQMTHI